MQIEYRLSLKDYQEVNQAHLKLQPWIYIFFWFLILIGLFFLSQAIKNFFLCDKHCFELIVAFVFLFFLFLLPPIFLCNPYFSSSIQNNNCKLFWEKLTNLHQPMTVEVNEESLKFKTLYIEDKFKWQFFLQAVETRNIFMLYESQVVFSMIPKRAFSNDAQVEEFRELLRTKIAKFIQV